MIRGFFKNSAGFINAQFVSGKVKGKRQKANG